MAKNEKGKEPTYYTVNSLITAITGVSKDDVAYEAAHRQVYRDFSLIRQVMGEYERGMPRIAETDKDSFVGFMRGFYEDDRLRDFLKRQHKGEDLTIDELDELIIHLVDNLSIGLSSEERDKLLKHIEDSDELYDLADNIRADVTADLGAILKIKHPESRRLFVEQYKRIMDEELRSLRIKVEVFARIQGGATRKSTRGLQKEHSLTN